MVIPVVIVVLTDAELKEALDAARECKEYAELVGEMNEHGSRHESPEICRKRMNINAVIARALCKEAHNRTFPPKVVAKGRDIGEYKNVPADELEKTLFLLPRGRMKDKGKEDLIVRDGDPSKRAIYVAAVWDGQNEVEFRGWVRAEDVEARSIKTNFGLNNREECMMVTLDKLEPIDTLWAMIKSGYKVVFVNRGF